MKKTIFNACQIIIDGQKEAKPLIKHLKQTALIAKDFGNKFNAGEWVYSCGILHDIGKYSEEFPKRLKGLNIRVDHSTAGAWEAYKRLGNIGKIIAYVIAGHHGGIPNGSSKKENSERTPLTERLKKNIPDYSTCPSEFIEIEKLSFPFDIQNNFEITFFIRMLYSCLVDADFLDTESFMNPEKSQHRRGYGLGSGGLRAKSDCALWVDLSMGRRGSGFRVGQY